MRWRTPRIALFLLATTLVAPAALARQEAAEATRPRNLVLMIADGFGPASRTMARDYSGQPLVLDGLVVGTVGTRSSNGFVTDSAAGATAYASGVRTYNGAIGVSATGQPVGTLLEAAEAKGLATGLVSTARMTHATPAAFASHVANRAMEALIGEQELAHGIDLMLGGGRLFFLPRGAGGARIDSKDLLAAAATDGYHVLRTREEFDAGFELPALGLFTTSHMSYEIDRDPQVEPSLAELTKRALELLSEASDEGFFLMIEGGRIDHAGHANDSAAHVHDVLAYDEAVGVALEFARADGNTLLVSVADHETGGLSLGRNENNVGVYAWKPEVVRRVRSSIESMTARAKTPADWRELLKTEAGVEPETKAEEALFAELDGLAGLRLSQRGPQIASELIAQRALTGWTTWGHTAVDILIFAEGPGAEAFRGHHDNDEVGRLMARQMGFELATTAPVMN